MWSDRDKDAQDGSGADAAEPQPSRENLLGLLDGIATDAGREASAARRATRRWNGTLLASTIVAAVLAAVAGTAGLTSATGRVPAAILALTASALSAFALFLRGDARGAQARKRAAAWDSVATDARLVAAFEGTRARTADLRNQVSLLQARTAAVRESGYEQEAKLREAGAGRLVRTEDYPLMPLGRREAPAHGHASRVAGNDLPKVTLIIPGDQPHAELSNRAMLTRLRSYEEEGLRQRRASFGKDHPATLQSAAALCITLRALGEAKRAREINEETLQRCRRALGDDHTQTLDTAYSLGFDLRALGEYDLARKIDEDTLERRLRVLGPDHTDSVKSAESVAEDQRLLGNC